MEQYLLCLDVGGTNCRSGFLDNRLDLEDERIDPTAELAAKSMADGLVSLIGQRILAFGKEKVKGVVIGVPATVDSANRCVLQAPNIPNFSNVPLADRIEEECGVDALVEKDVNLLLLADMREFAIPDDKNVIGIYYGTGVGNAIYLNGQILRGKNGVAGEIGHMPQLNLDTDCGCGNRSCIETVAGGHHLKSIRDEFFPDTDMGDMYEKHWSDEKIREQVDAIAIAAASEINILDPDEIIIGGGLPAMKGFDRDALVEKIREHTRKPYPAENLSIYFSKGGQMSGLYGGAITGWKRWSR